MTARMIARWVMLCGLVGTAALVGCGDSSGGGADGDTQVADGGDAQVADGTDSVQSDVNVPGPGECELNWISGFNPFLGVDHQTWDYLEPSQPGTLFFGYGFVGGGPQSSAVIDIQTCRLVDGAFQFAAAAEDDGAIYTLTIDAPDYPGLGVWQPGTAEGLVVRLELRDPFDPTYFYISESTASSKCEICVDATGRQGAFRCDALLETSGDQGGIRFGGFICPETEPGYAP